MLTALGRQPASPVSLVRSTKQTQKAAIAGLFAQKNDATDAEAICEAVTRANMRFVETKTPEQQSCLMLHRTRHLFIRQQTAVINAIRAHLAELGIVAPVGRKGVEELLNVVADPADKRVPDIARACIAALGAQLRKLKGADWGVRPDDHGLAPIR